MSCGIFFKTFKKSEQENGKELTAVMVVGTYVAAYGIYFTFFCF